MSRVVYTRVVLAMLIKGMSHFGKETKIFLRFCSRECKHLASWKMPTHGTIDVEITLAKGIIFKNIGMANGSILKLWAAHPYPKFSGDPPVFLSE